MVTGNFKTRLILDGLDACYPRPINCPSLEASSFLVLAEHDQAHLHHDKMMDSPWKDMSTSTERAAHADERCIGHFISVLDICPLFAGLRVRKYFSGTIRSFLILSRIFHCHCSLVWCVIGKCSLMHTLNGPIDKEAAGSHARNGRSFLPFVIFRQTAETDD